MVISTAITSGDDSYTDIDQSAVEKELERKATRSPIVHIGAAVRTMADYTDFTTDPSKGNGFAGGDWGDPDMGIL